MPLYDLKCPKCGNLERDVYQAADADMPQCVPCAVPVERVWLRSAPVHVFQADFYEHAGDKPLYFDSREKYKDHLRRNGMYADYVEGR